MSGMDGAGVPLSTAIPSRLALGAHASPLIPPTFPAARNPLTVVGSSVPMGFAARKIAGARAEDCRRNSLLLLAPCCPSSLPDAFNVKHAARRWLLRCTQYVRDDAGLWPAANLACCGPAAASIFALVVDYAMCGHGGLQAAY